jgi:hypothetical protein
VIAESHNTCWQFPDFGGVRLGRDHAYSTHAHTPHTQKPLGLHVSLGKIFEMCIEGTVFQGKDKTGFLLGFGGCFGIKKIERNM